MIANIIIIFSSLLFFCCSAALFSRAQANTQEKTSSLFSLSPQTCKNIDNKIVSASKKHIHKIETEAQDNVEHLRQTIEKKIAHLQEQHRNTPIKAIEIANLEDYLRKETSIINQIAAKQILFVINTAEQDAVLLRAKAREEQIKEKIKETALNFELFTPTILHDPEHKEQSEKISPVWKSQIRHTFNHNIALLKKIITDAEAPVHVQELTQALTDQSTWFDSTLRSAEYVHDRYQEQIIQKNDLLHKIILIHKKAAHFVAILAKSLNLSTNEKKKIDLAVLYDLSALVHKSSQVSPVFSPIFSPIIDNEIKVLVANTVYELTQKAHTSLPGFSLEELLETINAQSGTNLLRKELSSTQNRLEQMRQEQISFKQDMQKTVEATKEEALEAELLLRQSQEEITSYKQQIEQLRMSKKVDESLTEKTFTNKLEEARKTSLELQKTLDKTKQEIENIRKESLKESQEASEKIYTELSQRFIPLLEEKERSNLELELIIQDTKNRTQNLATDLSNQMGEQTPLQKAEQARDQAQKTSDSLALQNKIDKEENATKIILADELAQETILDNIKETLEDKNRETLEQELSQELTHKVKSQ